MDQAAGAFTAVPAAEGGGAPDEGIGLWGEDSERSAER